MNVFLAGVWFFCVVVCLEQIRVLVPVRLSCSDLQTCWRVPASRPLLAGAVVAGTGVPLEVLRGVSPAGWRASWLKGQLLLGSAGFSFVSAQFALLGVIADSEYVFSTADTS